MIRTDLIATSRRPQAGGQRHKNVEPWPNRERIDGRTIRRLLRPCRQLAPLWVPTFLGRQSVSRQPDKRGQKDLTDGLLWAVRQGRWSATAPLIPSVPGLRPPKPFHSSADWGPQRSKNHASRERFPIRIPARAAAPYFGLTPSKIVAPPKISTAPMLVTGTSGRGTFLAATYWDICSHTGTSACDS